MALIDRLPIGCETAGFSVLDRQHCGEAHPEALLSWLWRTDLFAFGGRKCVQHATPDLHPNPVRVLGPHDPMIRESSLDGDDHDWFGNLATVLEGHQDAQPYVGRLGKIPLGPSQQRPSRPALGTPNGHGQHKKCRLTQKVQNDTFDAEKRGLSTSGTSERIYDRQKDR